MKHVPVESSNIQSVAYDEENKAMEILFKSGQTYRYAGVSPETHQSLMNSKSKGGFFQKNIVGTYKGMDITSLLNAGKK